MEFLKRKWGFILALALILIAGGVIWYLLFYSTPKDYTGGILVRAGGIAKEMIKNG